MVPWGGGKSPRGTCANCDARNYASRSRTRFATQMPFSKAMKGGKRASLAAQVLSVEAKRAESKFEWGSDPGELQQPTMRPSDLD